MAIAFNASQKALVASGTSLTFSHTCAGSNLMLVLGVAYQTASDDITATYNSVSMTKSAVTASGARDYIFTLFAPSTGANNIVISSSGAAATIQGMSASYTGVVQGNPEATNTGVIAAASSASLSITTIAANAWVVGSINIGDNQTAVDSNGGQTSRQVYEANDNGESALDDKGPTATPGSVNIGWSWSPNSAASGICLASFAPAIRVGRRAFPIWL